MVRAVYTTTRGYIIMKIIMGFLPWILYFFLAGHSASSNEIAASAAILAVIVVAREQLKKGFILEWAGLVYFVLLLALMYSPYRAWFDLHGYLISNGIFAAIMWGSIIIGVPFTIQYARQQTNKMSWYTPGFKFVNYIISIV